MSMQKRQQVRIASASTMQLRHACDQMPSTCCPVTEQLASVYVDTGYVTIVFFHYINRVGYIVDVLKINTPSYMYAAVA